ncbi:endothelin-converting enzyme 1-like isoform X1 [Phymastichus coffea]|uniref:endothelin-converting enzyme 1-like isoform X1 n=1 Tax=Phymastichus coffea TaxID=108790 RepID=UPI00273C894A|nr:endothelin-converting enzyme 1-like isoform X1 [Phymastichus coffea]
MTVAMWLVIFIIGVLVSVTLTNPILNEPNAKVCETEECKVAATIINNSMKKTVDPCDDFYGYVCGNWETNFPRPEDKAVWNLDKMTENIAILESREVLEEDENDDDFSPLKYEKWWYRSCMDSEKIEENGIRSLEEVLDYFGGWPIAMSMSDWNDDNHDWQSVHEFYTTLKDLSSLFDIRVASDNRNSSRYVIELNKPGETLYENAMSDGNEKVVTDSYFELIRNVALIFMQERNVTLVEEQLTNDIENMIVFEKHLILLKQFSTESDDMEPSRVYITIDELQKYYDKIGDMKFTSQISWYRAITYLFKSIENVTIDSSEEIGVEDKYYLRKLSHLLSETPNRVIVNYIHWKFIGSSLNYANKEMHNVFAMFLRSIAKPDETVKVQERWQECINDMKLGIGYRYEYVKRHFSEETRKMVYDIASEMRGQMLDEMEHSTWLDDETRESAMVKLHALKWYIGNPNYFSKKDFLEHLYDGLTITTSYFENVQNAREFFMSRNLKRLRHGRNLKKYVKVDPLLAKSVYHPSRNVLILTAAQLSVPLLHASVPLSVNYGYLAPTMGQLIARTLEKEVNTDVYFTPWSNDFGGTYKTYETKTNCLLRQYNNYSVGSSTIDENMYDAIGLKVAYQAFQNSFENENIEKLPDLEELSDEQLFFVAYTLKYCQLASPKYQAEHEPTYFTPNDYRVIGPLSNSKDFAKAFSCPVNSPMNPENKCTL